MKVFKLSLLKSIEEKQKETKDKLTSKKQQFDKEWNRWGTTKKIRKG